MQKRAPTLGNLLVIVLFALSCFGLLLFMWESFGGPVPLKSKSYRLTIAFPRTLLLAEQSDVRISGVPVGHVVSLVLGKDGLTHATIQIDGKYAPIRSDMHAILRQKTLLGETYVQLIPESRTAAPLPDEGQLPNGQVEPSVTLDDILAAFDPRTRKSFQIWMQSLAESFNHRGEQINASFAALQPFVESANKLVAVLASQEGALRASVHNTGVVFDALTEREGQFRGLFANGDRAFHGAAEASQAFARAFKALPAFERDSQPALRSLDSFATDTIPLLDQIRPAEEQLTPLLLATRPFAPQFESFVTSLGRFTKAAEKGLPAVKQETRLTEPVLAALSPVLHNFNPFLAYLSMYVPELQALFANSTAATLVQEKNSNNPRGPKQHYLRLMNVFTPEALAVYGQRIGTNRANAYPLPGTFSQLASGLPVFDSRACSDSAPSLSEESSETIERSSDAKTAEEEATQFKEAIKLLLEYHVVNRPGSTSNEVAAPPCKQQGSFTFNGQTGQFPHATPFK
jgi:phospholipid/cholesterol/gamma-HCH transport system substrate-binding protein